MGTEFLYRGALDENICILFLVISPEAAAAGVL